MNNRIGIGGELSFRPQKSPYEEKHNKSWQVHHGSSQYRFLPRAVKKLTTTGSERDQIRRDESKVFLFIGALSPVLIDTTCANNFSKSYLISPFLTWNRFPSSLCKFTEESVHCVMKGQTTWASQSGTVALLLGADAATGWKLPVSRRCSFHTWLWYLQMWMRSLAQFPAQKPIDIGNAEEVPQNNMTLSSESGGSLQKPLPSATENIISQTITTHPHWEEWLNLPPCEKVFLSPKAGQTA